MASQAGESLPLLVSRTVCDDDIRARTRHRAALTLLPLTVTYFLAYITTIVIMKPYFYDVVADEFHFKLNSSSQRPCTTSYNNTQEQKVPDEIQKRVSTIELYFSLTSYLCAAPSVLILGPLTDKYGRKLGILFPVIGTLLKQVVYAVVIGARLPLMFLLIGHVLESVCGSFSAMLSSMFTVVSDVTDPGPQRSFRITVMEAVQTMSVSAGQYAVGQWVKSSYFYPLTYSISANIICLLIALFILPETVQVHRLVAPFSATHPANYSRLRTSCRQLLVTCLLKLKRSLTLYVKDDFGRQRVSMRRLCLAVFVLTVAVTFPGGVLELYLMKYPRCWALTKVFTFLSIQIVSSWIAILVMVALLQRVFKMADRHMAIIGVISSMMTYLFLSLAVTDVMIYEAAVLGVLIRAILPMLRSVMSSLVDSTDQGAMYAGMGCVEALGPAVFGSLSNRVYYSTLSVWDGAVFAMFAGMMLTALGLLIFLNVLFSRNNQGRDLTYEQVN